MDAFTWLLNGKARETIIKKFVLVKTDGHTNTCIKQWIAHENTTENRTIFIFKHMYRFVVQIAELISLLYCY